MTAGIKFQWFTDIIIIIHIINVIIHIIIINDNIITENSAEWAYIL